MVGRNPTENGHVGCAMKEPKANKTEAATIAFELNVASTKDRVTEVIDAISQIMEQSRLSVDGRDKRAVYAWFMERYRPGVLLGKKDI